MPEIPIKRALIAVYDKTGIADFARTLVDEFGIEIISTGGTAGHLKEAGIPVTMVEEVTGFPEMLDGRVKTLHPKIHAAILADRDNPEHMRQLAEQGIAPIDMVVVNLYPFEETIKKPGCTFEEAIEMIDIGGPCLLRAAAKNHKHVCVLTKPDDVGHLLRYLREPKEYDEASHAKWIAERAWETYWMVSRYDASIAQWLSSHAELVPYTMDLRPLFMEESGLERPRYGENPHQQAQSWDIGLATDRYISRPPMADEIPMSYNNLVDADAALDLCAELTRASMFSGSLPAPRGLKPAARADGEEPLASARAATGIPSTSTGQGALQSPDPQAPCWLLTWTTYGSWLPGDERGFVSRTPTIEASHKVQNIPGTLYEADRQDLKESAKERMHGKPVELSPEHACIVDSGLLEVASSHDVGLVAYSIMRDHVHVICQSNRDGSELLQLFKGVSSRRLGQQFDLPDAPRWWTRSGSKRFLRKGDDPAAAVAYVCEQNAPLVVRCYDAMKNVNAPFLRGAARAEARGSSGIHPCCVFIKHTNACGAAADAEPIEVYRRAYLGDPNAAMGGVLAVNFTVDVPFAEAVMGSLQRWGKAAGAGAFFVEVFVAPSFDDEAVEIIQSRKKWGERVRLLTVDMTAPPSGEESDFKRIAGGMLTQTRDTLGLNEDQWKVATERTPTDREMADLRLAWLICKHTKSNAISICKDGMLIGNGAGQMSRIMSCRIATWLAKENGHAESLAGSVAASDAFFPFRDGPDILADAGITAIIQPGGSKRDDETIAACNERGISMILTGTRHFKH